MVHVAGARRRRVVASAMAGLLALSACTSAVVPPAHVESPTTVWLLREAMHVGVVLPTPAPEEPLVEYGFGEWSWYALGHTSWYRVFPAMLWPTASTCSRRVFRCRSAEEFARHAAGRGLRVDPIVVEAAAAEALRCRLESAFADRGAIVERVDWEMVFAPVPGGYWLPYNCADAAADWLEKLGCEVGWALFRGSLRPAVPCPRDPPTAPR